MKIADILKDMDYGPSPESTDQAKAWLAKHEGRFALHIGGKKIQGEAHFDSLVVATRRSACRYRSHENQ